MADHWPLANRCHEIIDRLGKASVALFDSPAVNAGPSLEEDNQYYGQITSDYMDAELIARKLESTRATSEASDPDQLNVNTRSSTSA